MRNINILTFVISAMVTMSAQAQDKSVVEVPASQSSKADGKGSWAPDHILFGGVSAHYGGNGSKLNGSNPGLGFMWSHRDVSFGKAKLKNVDVSAGFYKNSETWDDKDHYTVYAAVHYLPWKFLKGDAGVTFGLAHGYKLAPIVPIVAPTVCWTYACVMVTPPFKDSAGAVSLQFRLPL